MDAALYDPDTSDMVWPADSGVQTEPSVVSKHEHLIMLPWNQICFGICLRERGSESVVYGVAIDYKAGIGPNTSALRSASTPFPSELLDVLIAAVRKVLLQLDEYSSALPPQKTLDAFCDQVAILLRARAQGVR
jgi:hypothetical protein